MFVGTEFDAISGRHGDAEPTRKTPWGEIAWQLGGNALFAKVAQHDAQGVAPAGDVLREMLPAGPTLILMDELLNYISSGRNPSTLEQRTGRIDRIGAKTETCGRPIRVYLPYIGATQDEKMYRVVMDRERWFSVVMGEQYQVDSRTTERLAERLPFPAEAAEALAFRLEVNANRRDNQSP